MAYLPFSNAACIASWSPLTRGLWTCVDIGDTLLVVKYKWYATVDGKNGVSPYASRKNYDQRKVRNIRLHRVIIQAPEGHLVDHRDHNTLNNCRSNLRLATPSQNSANAGPIKTNAIGLKGVSWHSQNNRWQATIRINKIKKHLGYFDSREAARDAYVLASIDAHGEFAPHLVEDRRFLCRSDAS